MRSAGAAGKPNRRGPFLLALLVLLAVFAAVGVVTFDSGPPAPSQETTTTEAPAIPRPAVDTTVAHERELAGTATPPAAAALRGPTLAAQCRLATSETPDHWRD